jgi:HK97 family phage major capsid protein
MHKLNPVIVGLCRDRDGGTDTRNPVLVRLLAERDTQVRFIDETLARVETEERDLVDAERNNLTAARERIGALDAQIEPLEEFEQLRDAHRSSSSSYSPGRSSSSSDDRRPLTTTQPRGPEYRTAGAVIVDRIRAHDGDADARDRLRDANLTRDAGWAQGESRAVAHQTTDETPGLLPEAIRGQIDNDIDAARPFMASVGIQPLDTPGKTFERPVVTQHTTAGEQTAEKAELPSRPLIISGVPFNKRTFGGALNISRQDIDWTSPAAWDAVIRDLEEQYALETENAAADAFAAAVTATEELTTAAGASPTLAELSAGFYGAAAAAYGGVKRLPDHVWMSLDMWAAYGPILDASAASNFNGPGAGNDSAVNTLEGAVMRLPRTVVPSFPAGTIIVGVRSKTEVYEQRIGLLQAVQPSVLGVEVAYGGYMASGTLRAEGFSKIVNAA